MDIHNLIHHFNTTRVEKFSVDHRGILEIVFDDGSYISINIDTSEDEEYDEPALDSCDCYFYKYWDSSIGTPIDITE